ncbi:helix-turn-helix domain-containing protein [Streptomyces synnematoformans]|uniref:HTH deoR-type domain-containing protein n=1 Tax=Streptomyces synnematoformans TaxID=415721 RepID=A0ABP5IY94_9ACTN
MTDEKHVAARRTEVETLWRSGMSQRGVARHLGVSKDTVRRDLAHLGLGGAGGADGADDDAPQARPLDLAGAHPTVVELARVARAIPDSVARHNPSVQREHLIAVARRLADLIAACGPPDPMSAHLIGRLTAQLGALATTTSQGEPR